MLYLPRGAVPSTRPPRTGRPSSRPVATLKRADAFEALLRSFPLTCFWKCQETGGSQLIDTMGNAPAANTQGTSTLFQQDGLLESALKWDGTAQYAQLANGTVGTLVNGADAVTVLAICRLTAAPTVNLGVVYAHIINTSGGGFTLIANQNQTVLTQVRSAAADTVVAVTSTQVLALNNWYLLCSVADFANKTLNLYINGVLAANALGTNWSSLTYVQGTATSHDNIGNLADGVRYWPGYLSHIAVIKGRVNAPAQKDLARILGVTL